MILINNILTGQKIMIILLIKQDRKSVGSVIYSLDQSEGTDNYACSTINQIYLIC